MIAKRGNVVEVLGAIGKAEDMHVVLLREVADLVKVTILSPRSGGKGTRWHTKKMRIGSFGLHGLFCTGGLWSQIGNPGLEAKEKSRPAAFAAGRGWPTCPATSAAPARTNAAPVRSR